MWLLKNKPLAFHDRDYSASSFFSKNVTWFSSAGISRVMDCAMLSVEPMEILMQKLYQEH